MSTTSNYTEFGTLPTLPKDKLEKLLAFIDNIDSVTLPMVTDTDNGKVLTVIEGKWGAAVLEIENEEQTAPSNP